MPTVDQLYTIIGAKDGVIYDLQLGLQGLVQEKQKLEADLEEAREKLVAYEANSKPMTEIPVPQSVVDSEDDFGATFKPGDKVHGFARKAPNVDG